MPGSIRGCPGPTEACHLHKVQRQLQGKHIARTGRSCQLAGRGALRHSAHVVAHVPTPKRVTRCSHSLDPTCLLHDPTTLPSLFSIPCFRYISRTSGKTFYKNKLTGATQVCHVACLLLLFARLWTSSVAEGAHSCTHMFSGRCQRHQRKDESRSSAQSF